jgi:hypothetical protein
MRSSFALGLQDSPSPVGMWGPRVGDGEWGMGDPRRWLHRMTRNVFTVSGVPNVMEISEPWQVWESTCGFRLALARRQAPLHGFRTCPRRKIFRCRHPRGTLGPRYRKPRSAGSSSLPLGNLLGRSVVHIRLLELRTVSRITNHPDSRVNCVPDVKESGQSINRT